jgi:hypothetical protein
VHLAERDIALVAVARAPLPDLLAYRERMGWTFQFVSSAGSDFNFDFGVSFTEAEQASEEPIYNFGTSGFPADEAPGISCFCKDAAGDVFHNLVHLAPRATPRQTCTDYRLRVDPTPAFLSRREDYFGNHIEYFSIEGPHRKLEVAAESTVEVRPLDVRLLEQSPAWEAAALAARHTGDPPGDRPASARARRPR